MCIIVWMKVRMYIQVDNTDIGCLVHFLVWMELGHTK